MHQLFHPKTVIKTKQTKYWLSLDCTEIKFVIFFWGRALLQHDFEEYINPLLLVSVWCMVMNAFKGTVSLKLPVMVSSWNLNPSVIDGLNKLCTLHLPLLLWLHIYARRRRRGRDREDQCESKQLIGKAQTFFVQT